MDNKVMDDCYKDAYCSYYGVLDSTVKPRQGLHIFMLDEHIKRTVEKEAESLVDKLKNLLPRQMFELKVQAKVAGRIIASRTISAYRKDVTQHMYGGDITRKMKLREKQKKGKKKMKERGRVNIPQDVFLKMMRAKD